MVIGSLSIPETIFVDATGHIQIHKRGPMELLTNWYLAQYFKIPNTKLQAPNFNLQL